MENTESLPKLGIGIKDRFLRVFSRGQVKETEDAKPTHLKEHLLRTYTGDLLTPGDFPSSFELGEFGKEAEKVAKATARDPKHREYLSKAVIDRFGRVFFISLREGDENSVSSPRPVPFEYDLMTIHSHPDDTPFSPPDLDHLFSNYRAGRNGWTRIMPATMVITPTQKVLLFLTSETPPIPNNYSTPKMDMIEEPAMEEEFTHLLRGEHIGDLASISNKRMYALTRVAHKYQLKIYACPTNRNIATLAH